MIISKDNKSKLPKKLLPKKCQAVVSFLSFISSDDDIGIVLYKNNDEYLPAHFVFDVEMHKLKCKTVDELIGQSYAIFDNNRNYIKLAKEKFEEEFLTKIVADDEKDIFELVMENERVVLKKHIICVIKSCEEIEHLINPEFVRDCKLVRLNELENDCNIAEYCLEFLCAGE